MPAQSKTRYGRPLQDASKGLIRRNARSVLIVAVPPVRALDVFGPAEVFGDANRLNGGGPVYDIRIVSAGEDRVISSHIATPVQTDQTYREHHGTIDTLLIAGGLGAREMRYEKDFLVWLRDQSTKVRRFGSVCTGALVLAEAGLLDGRRATTHWNWADELMRNYPQVKVDPARIYIRDGSCYTSAGVTAGIDLALALVEEDLGRSVALQVAQMMVVFLRRPGGQSQFSATLAAQAQEGHALGDLLAWLPDNLRGDLSVEKLARRAAMSPRNFARSFQREVGTTPAKHIENLRLEAARRLLESTKFSLEEVADASGFASAEGPEAGVFSARGCYPKPISSFLWANPALVIC
jgi:transcriptional regulator GlxA family with amidase domain